MYRLTPTAQILIALGICLFLYWCGKALFYSVMKERTIEDDED